MTSPLFYLASTSPRRRELLESWGFVFELINPQVEESKFPHESPVAYVQRMSSLKSLGGWETISVQQKEVLPVLGADTIVCTNENRILGKPRDKVEARLFLSLLSGTDHSVLTAVSLTDRSGKTFSSLSTSKVTFKKLSALEIDQYVKSGEPLDKAGAYGIQGGAKAFVEKIEGSFTGIIGLPKTQTMQLLCRVGITSTAGIFINRRVTNPFQKRV